MICDSPFYTFARTGERVPVPCGRCPPCKIRRVNSWVFRLMQEEKVHQCSHFITLTYDPAHVPITDHAFMTLRKKDVQDFFKRLRKNSPELTIKYYAVGEYGTNNRRPHYHVIVFGVPDPELYAKAWSPFGRQIGSLHIGQVSGDSIAYCLKYIDKPYSRKHERDDREREFALMSKGLGLNYITQDIVDYHQADITRMYVTKPGGYRIPIPRYYRKILYSSDQMLQQISYIDHEVYKAEEKDRREFSRLYAHVPGYEYESYKEAQKLGRNKSFHTQKSRDV